MINFANNQRNEIHILLRIHILIHKVQQRQNSNIMSDCAGPVSNTIMVHLLKRNQRIEIEYFVSRQCCTFIFVCSICI